MKCLQIQLIFLLSTTIAVAGPGEYNVDLIPDSLKKDANVVKRIEEERYSLKSAGEAYYYRKYALTILNENGDKYAAFHQYYDRFVNIRNIEGVLYDDRGIVIRELRSRDIQDLSGVSDVNLMDDDRVKVHRFNHKTYPYTVEYTVEIRYVGTMFFPYWFPVEDEHFAVQESRFTLECPLNYAFRYKSVNYRQEPLNESTGDKKRFVWEVSNIPALVPEQYAPSFRQLSPYLMLGPSDFEMQNYKGNMSSWKELGNFLYALKKDRDVLPDEVKQTVKELTKDFPDPKERLIKLYEFMQRHTRYVSIQLGIGGWQPFPAEYVARKGYGDCKALTNYMYSLLKESGIPSYYAVIRAGDNQVEVETEFPSSHFNHVILCAVPDPQDTVWLECTSQSMPAGYLGDFTCDRYALLVDESGGKLVRTPKYGKDENLQLRHISAQVDDEGKLQAAIQTAYKGLQQDRLHLMLNHLSREKVKEFLDAQFDLATYNINSFDYQEFKSSLPEIQEKLVLSVDHYATISGKRLFITPNILNRSGRKLKPGVERKYGIELRYEYRDEDEVEIRLPAGYKLESLPEDVEISSIFGSYTSSLKMDGDKIVYKRVMEQNNGKFSRSDYPEMVRFYDAVYKSDRSKIVFVRTVPADKKPF